MIDDRCGGSRSSGEIVQRTLPVLAAAVAGLLMPLSAVAATPAPARTIAWAPCQQDATAECGTLTVPVDWDEPSGPTLQLAVARRKATDPGARIGPLIVNPGGPGLPAVDMALKAEQRFSADIRRRVDVVGFDPRGVGGSRQVECAVNALTTPLPYKLRNQREFERWQAFLKDFRDGCRAETGPLVDRVDTLSVVRDMEALRAALGDPRLTFMGISYGTMLGQQYAERYPDRVRAVVMDSVVDHSLSARQLVDLESRNAERIFTGFVGWCARTSTCALHGRDVPALWHSLLAKARRGELPVPGAPDRRLTDTSSRSNYPTPRAAVSRSSTW
jgi:pimeloyl-ACP methyl ester carboxylesterase